MILIDKQLRLPYVKLFVFILVIGITLFILKTFALPIFFESHDTFQLRDKRKSDYKLKITSGPIDLDRGIVDMVTLGMSKVEVHQRFGDVLIRPLTIEEGLKFGGSYGGMDGNKNKSDELLDTVYAWVEYTSWNRPEEAVRSIRFKPAEFTRLFNADEQLWIRYKNKNVIITKDMNQNKIIEVLNIKNSDILKITPSGIILRNSHAVFIFKGTDQTLASLTISSEISP